MKSVYVHASLCLTVASKQADFECYAPEAHGGSKKSWQLACFMGLLNADDSPARH